MDKLIKRFVMKYALTISGWGVLVKNVQEHMDLSVINVMGWIARTVWKVMISQSGPKLWSVQHSPVTSATAFNAQTMTLAKFVKTITSLMLGIWAVLTLFAILMIVSSAWTMIPVKFVRKDISLMKSKRSALRNALIM